MPSNILTSAYEGNSKLFQEQEVAWTTGTGFYIASTESSNPTLASQIVPSYTFGVPEIFAQGLSVSKKSKNLPLAMAFAEYVTNNSNQVAFTDIAKGFLPGTKAAASSPSSTDTGTQAQADADAFKALGNAKALGPVIFNSTMSTYFNQQVTLALSGQESSQTALTNSVNEANQLLNG
jgi:multiple sugar transport system substrate-binding protein